ncbi:MAG: hypothetical protein FJ138_08090, partial [Deltaproteobacteria bacterium]|nr:hypothetical protein [Deltaproteobacteria bacterium]
MMEQAAELAEEELSEDAVARYEGALLTQPDGLESATRLNIRAARLRIEARLTDALRARASAERWAEACALTRDLEALRRLPLRPAADAAPPAPAGEAPAPAGEAPAPAGEAPAPAGEAPAPADAEGDGERAALLELLALRVRERLAAEERWGELPGALGALAGCDLPGAAALHARALGEVALATSLALEERAADLYALADVEPLGAALGDAWARALRAYAALAP